MKRIHPPLKDICEYCGAEAELYAMRVGDEYYHFCYHCHGEVAGESPVRKGEAYGHRTSH